MFYPLCPLRVCFGFLQLQWWSLLHTCVFVVCCCCFFFFFFFIYIRLSRLLLEGRTKMVSAHLFKYLLNHIWSFNDLIIQWRGWNYLHLRLYRLEASISVFTPPKYRIPFPPPLPPLPPPPHKKKKKKKKNTRCIRKPPQKVLCFSLPQKCYQCLSLAYL